MINNNIMKKRIKVFEYLTYMLFAILIFRVFYLQVISRDYYKNKLYNKMVKNISVSSPRGNIYDNNGNLLVSNKLEMTIFFNNDNNLDKDELISLAYYISDYLDVNYNKLTLSYMKEFFLLMHEDEIRSRIREDDLNKYQKRIISNNDFYKIKKDLVTSEDLEEYTDVDKKAIYLYYLMNNGYSYEDKIIKENCSINEFIFFSENAHNLKGFKADYTYTRDYLYGDTLRSILGNVGYIPSANSAYYLNRGYHLNDKVGLSGLELQYDDYLKGKDATYKVYKKEKYLVTDGEKGNDIYLTININLQKFSENILMEEMQKAKMVASTKYYNHSYIVISDTKGNILSMVGKEIFNNKIFDRSMGVITDTMTPGSSVKAASMLVGYDTNTIKVGEYLYDECLKIKNTPKKCSFTSMGRINDIDALRQSSNVYQFKIAIKLGGGVYKYNGPLNIKSSAFDIYKDYFNRFGLGVNTGIELLNESRGYHGTSRLPGLLLDYAIGQYDTYTALQLNQYISTIANGGDRYKMHLLKKISNNYTDIYLQEDEILNNVAIPKKYFDRVTKGLISVINEGTGYGYVNPSYKAAGKTGTSESFMSIANSKTLRETNSTSFVMFMPYDNPKIAISMMSPNISYGSYYPYAINKYVIRKITDNIYKFLT